MLTLTLIFAIKKIVMYLKTKQGLKILVQSFYRKHVALPIAVLLTGMAFLFTNANAQQLNYDVIKGENIIGKIHMDCVQINDHVNYSFTSDVKVSFILTFDIATQSVVVFEKNHLLQSKVLQKINGREKINNETAWNGQFYLLKQSGEKNKTLYDKITFSAACLYYAEPINIKSVYSETSQKSNPLKALPNHRYVLELPDGDETFYSYTNGICTLVEAHTTLAVIKFKLDESSMLANNLSKK